MGGRCKTELTAEEQTNDDRCAGSNLDARHPFLDCHGDFALPTNGLLVVRINNDLGHLRDYFGFWAVAADMPGRNMVHDWDGITKYNDLLLAIHKAVMAERERCAKLAEQTETWNQTVEDTDATGIYTGTYSTVKRTTLKWRDGKAIAAAIRAG